MRIHLLSRSLFRCAALAFLFGHGVLAYGETTGIDFSAGFRHLHALGFPETKGFVWSRIKEDAATTSASQRWTEYTSGKTAEFGWWDEKSQRLITKDGEALTRLSEADMKTRAEKRKVLVARMEAISRNFEEDLRHEYNRISYDLSKLSEGVLESTPVPADLSAHVKEVIAAYKKAASAASKEDRYQFDTEIGESAEETLRFACLVWGSGNEALANQLAEVAFAHAEDAEVLIDSVISLVAEEELDQVNEAFSKDFKWAEYAANLKKLPQKYSRGWKNGKRIEVLAEKVAQRSLMTTPPPVSLTAPWDTPDRQQLLGRLVTEPAFVDLSAEVAPEDQAAPAALWIIRPISTKCYRGPMAELLSKQLEALPLLAALVDDQVLTQVMDAAGESEESDSTAADSSMVLPQTRGKLIAPWLESLVTNPENLGKQAMALYEQFKGKTPEQIAWHYLNDEAANLNQQSDAIDVIAAQGGEGLKKLETWLEGRPALTSLGQARAYLTKVKEAGKSFMEKFSARALVEIKDDSKTKGSDFEYSSTASRVEQLRTQLNQLKQLTRADGLRGLLLDLAEGKESYRSLSESIVKAMGADPGEKEVNEILAVAQTVKEVRPQTSFLYLMASLKRIIPEDGKIKGWIHDTPEELSYWTALLNDERALPIGSSQNLGSKVGHFAAQILDLLHTPEEDMERRDRGDMVAQYALRGSLSADGFRARALQFLKGETPAPFEPGIKDTARQTALEGELKALTPADFPVWFEKLTKPEKLYLWKKCTTDQTWPEPWIAASRTIREVIVAADAPWAKEYDWASLKGKEYDDQLIMELLDALRKKELPPGFITIEADAYRSSLVVTVGPALAQAEFQSCFVDGKPGQLCACAYFGNQNQSIEYPLPKQSHPEPEVEYIEQFRETIQEAKRKDVPPGYSKLYLAVTAP